MKLSKHFTLEEFHSKDGTPYPAQWVDCKLKPLVKDLETIRGSFNSPLRITSAYRPEAHNKKVKKAAKNSRHVQGDAVDFYVVGISPIKLHKFIIELIRTGQIKDGGVGLYVKDGHVHYDHGAPGRRW